MLLRHELLGSGCKIKVESEFHDVVILQGDINSMVQVINNLVSNAADAEKPKGGGTIVIAIDRDDRYLNIRVEDTGIGIPEEVKHRLFKQMITSKGAQGTGLGIYISNSIIKARFDGKMWVKENPKGGSIFGISIPAGNVKFEEKRKGELEQ